MNTSRLAATLSCLPPLLLTTLRLSAAVAPGSSDVTTTNVAAGPRYATNYTAVARTPNSRTWERINWSTNGARVFARTNRYEEIATGLHYLSPNGDLLDSSDQISIQPGGGAAASQGQHTVQFPSDIYGGIIAMTAPDGVLLKSQLVGLSYSDGTNSTLIATVTNSIGQLTPSGNQLIYTNALSGGGITASVRYTYTKASFEQDILLESQLPPPEKFGLSSNALLEVVTEFFDAPQPVTGTTPDADQGEKADPVLSFGAMTMGPGHAFVLGEQDSSSETPVLKEWSRIGDRQLLFEQVRLVDIQNALMNLPAPRQSLNAIPGKIRRTAGGEGTFPRPRPGHASTNVIKTAQVKARPGTVVLDYTTLNTTLTNYVFRADMTYFISGTVTLSGTNTFEGGVVLKFATNGIIQALNTVWQPTLVWGGQAYRPVLFTAMHDDTAGEQISGSSGTPFGYYGNPMFRIIAPSSSPTLTNLRISYAKTGLNLASATFNLYDIQFVDCETGFFPSGGVTAWLNNALFSNVKTNLLLGGGCTLKAQNATFDTSSCLGTGPATQGGSSFFFTNCIFANISNLFAGVIAGTNGDHNGFYNSPYDTRLGANKVTSTDNPFQPVGGGSYYLSPNCSFRDAGTSAITPGLLADLSQKTTYPPLVQAGGVLSSKDITLYPQAQRDTDAIDLGFHYDSIDLELGHVVVTNAININVAPGTVIAAFGTNALAYSVYGLAVCNGAQFLCQGTPTQPARIVEWNTVQESTPAGWFPPGYCLLTDDVNEDYSPTAAYFNFRFTDFSTPGGDIYHIGMIGSASDFRDCQFYGGQVLSIASITFTNCLFERSYPYLENDFSNTQVLRNNLFHGGVFNLYTAMATNGVLIDNLFDRTSIGFETGQNSYYGGHNAFVTNCDRLSPNFASDIILTNTDYRAGPLGNFYYPTNGGMLSTLINADSTTADTVGLYHYTVMTNLIGGLEIKETNSFLDIGFHYVAVGTTGFPINTDGDGNPDYAEDLNGNGNGTDDPNNWLNYDSPNSLVTGDGLVVFTPLKP